MKVLAWILIVFWAICILVLGSGIIAGGSNDLITNLLALAAFGAQIYFNFIIVKKLK